MSGSDSRQLGSRLFEACLATFVAAAALYGAVCLLRAIWLWLLVIGLVAGAGWIALRRLQDW